MERERRDEVRDEGKKERNEGHHSFLFKRKRGRPGKKQSY